MRDGQNIPQSITLGSEHETYLKFRYIACVLPRLSAMAHLNTDNVVTALMLPLMQYAREHRVTVYGEAHRSLRQGFWKASVEHKTDYPDQKICQKQADYTTLTFQIGHSHH